MCSASFSAKDSEFSSSSRVDSRDTLNREGSGKVSDKDVRYSNQRRTRRDDLDSNESRNVRFRCIVAAKEGAIIIGARGRNIKVIKDMGIFEFSLSQFVLIFFVTLLPATRRVRQSISLYCISP